MLPPLLLVVSGAAVVGPPNVWLSEMSAFSCLRLNKLGGNISRDNFRVGGMDAADLVVVVVIDGRTIGVAGLDVVILGIINGVDVVDGGGDVDGDDVALVCGGDVV